MEEYIVGRNAVREALRSGRGVQRILIANDAGGGAVQSIVREAFSAGIEVRKASDKQLEKYARGLAHQGVVAMAAQVEFKELYEVLEESFRLTDAPFLVLVDGIEDPHNLGAIIRTAECAGASGILIPKRHAAPVNATVAKTSAGAIHHVPLVQIGNVAYAIKDLQKAGFWIYGAHMEGDCTIYDADFSGPTVLVVGNEGKGLSRLTKELCDKLVTIPMYGRLNSLNASVAAALFMYEAIRQRR